MDSFEIVDGGGITTPKGFRATGVHAGFRKNPGRLDFALVVADERAKTTGVFTQNTFCAAPVIFCKDVLKSDEDDKACGVKDIKLSR